MTEFILNLIESWGYAGIFVLMVIENVFPPVPSEVIMGLGGIAAAQGRFDFWTLVAVGVAGTTLGNWVWYGVGRWIGYERLKPFIDRVYDGLAWSSRSAWRLLTVTQTGRVRWYAGGVTVGAIVITTLVLFL